LYSSFSEVGVGIAEYSVRAKLLNLEESGVAAPFMGAFSVIFGVLLQYAFWANPGLEKG
jgi:hypothetical protein